MNEQQRRLSEDLAGQFSGEIRVDRITCGMYATDASLYEVTPLAVAFPKTAEDVSLLAGYAADQHLPLIPRGAGSGLAGGCLGSGIVVDFSRHMTAIESIDSETVRVQPGLVCDELNRELRKQGRYFAPDPSNAGITTIGGMVGVDAAGSHAVRVGSTRDHVLAVDLVLMGGERFEAGYIPLDALRKSGVGEEPLKNPFEAAFGTIEQQKSSLRERLSRLAQMLSENNELIERYQPPMIRNCSGYQLRGVLRESHLNLPRLLTGSEGTLGLSTSIVLHTSPLPDFRGVALILFGDMDSAIEAVSIVAELQPSACDLLDRRILSLGRQATSYFSKVIPESAEAGLIIEQTAFSSDQARDRIRMVVQRLKERGLSCVVGAEAYEPEEVESLWSLPRRVVPLLTRLIGSSRPQPFVEDIALPPEAMKEFLHRAQRVMQKHEVTTSLYAHAASGQVHLRPFMPTPTPADGERIEAIARELYQIVFQLRGTISGEHGDGLSRTAFVRSQYGPLYGVFQKIKDLFDPKNLMNPGKIVSDDPHLTRKNFRDLPQDTQQTVELQLKWNDETPSEAVLRCNGCGNCRTQADDMRMCPFFQISPAEEASPRSKANLLRQYLSGELTQEDFTSQPMKHLSNFCFNCKQCRLECPSEVDIPKMMIEARASYVQTNGLSRADWILSRAHSFGALGCAFPAFSNWLLSNSASRWVVEKVLGISRQRKLPRFARRTFLRAYAKRNPPRPHAGQKKTVIYFVDSYANHHDPELAEAFVAIMNHNGYEVYVPPDQQASGMAMISAGDLDSVADLVEENLRVLGEFAIEGFPIICTEPAAALCFKEEYPNLSEHPDLETVRKETREAGDFLLRLHQRGELKTDFQPHEFRIGYHTPCHTKALGKTTPFRELLALIPGVSVHNIEQGCSGMAGAFGLTKQNFATSLEIGRPLHQALRTGDFSFGAAECSSCRLQMEQGGDLSAIHPLKIMALAYGLMPELADRLKPSSNPLLIS